MAKNTSKNTAVVPVLDSSRVQYFPASMLHVAPDYNVRMFDPDNNAEDKAFIGQILSVGKVHTPLVARVVGGKIEIMQGHRRKAAVDYILAKGMAKAFPNLPVLGVTEGMSEVDRTYDIATSNSGKKLSAIENARLVIRLIALGEKPAKIAARLGLKSTKWVSDLERMASMPDYLAQAVYAEHIAGTLAQQLNAESVSKGFDLAEVWTQASEAARDKSKWDAETNSYLWKVTQKHVDTVLETIGKRMTKSRIGNRPTGGAVTSGNAAAPSAVEALDKAAASLAGSDATAPAATAPVQATSPAKGNGKPRYTIGKDGCTILDIHGSPLAVCDNARVSAAIVADLLASSRAEPILVTHRAPMAQPALEAAKKAADKAEAAVPAKGAAKPVTPVQPVPTASVAVAKVQPKDAIKPSSPKPGRNGKPGARKATARKAA